MKKLVIAEKPSVAREIARVLGCNQNTNGAIVGPSYVVTWALGHLVTLATPEEIDKKWQVWRLEDLPMIPQKFLTKVIPNTSKQYSTVKSWLTNKEISELIIATDAGREGELVARWIINKVGFNKPIKRLWISSMTDKAIKEGFQNLVDAKKYDNLFYSAESRAIADWLVGLNVSRALTCKYNAQLSAGRVQTPTLALIVEREEEINRFTPKEFYEVIVTIKGVSFTYYEQNGDSRIFSKDKADKIINELKNKVAKVTSVVRNKKHELPPLLYDLTSLQQDANRLYAMSAKSTLDIVQKLYEVDKYLTYPRTDSKYLSLDMYDTIKERLLTITSDQYKKVVKGILSKPINKSKRIFDNSKVSDHHAIILTEQKTNLFNLSASELRIYNLVMKRFIAAFMNDYVFNHINVEIKIDGKTFKASGKSVIDLGWKQLYQQVELDEEQISTIPEFNQNESFSTFGITLKKGLTKAPDRYTEASLLSAMEHPGKFVNSKEHQKILEQVSGIGTPATRADIIERIFSAGYVELRGRTIYPTEKGKQLIKLVPTNLKSPSLTAEWEMRLSKIEKGTDNKKSFIDDMKKNTAMLIDEVMKVEHKYRHDNATKQKCPNCGKELLEVSNKIGKSLVCVDRECGYRKNISRNTNFMCPTCKKKLTEIKSGEKDILICKCGFKENKESFLSKLNDKKGEMNKKSVDIFLKQQHKEIPTNNPFLDIFKEMKK